MIDQIKPIQFAGQKEVRQFVAKLREAQQKAKPVTPAVKVDIRSKS